MSSVAVKVTVDVQSEHASQGPPSAPWNPAEQKHEKLPEEDSEFAGQNQHSDVPTSLLNIPAMHAVHAAPSDVPLYPAKHLQSVNASLPDAELVPSGHVEHSPAPVVALYVPTSHALHCNPSEAAVYPTTHLQSIRSLLPDAELVCKGHTAQESLPS